MIQQVKENLFTIPGLIVTAIHLFVAVGGVTTWVLFQTQVMGVDPMAAMQQPSAKAARR